MLTWKDVLEFSVQGTPKPTKRVEKTNLEWSSLLTPEQFRVTRLKGTEAPHSGTLCSSHEAGEYNCVCCNTPLFDSAIKFNSGSGWPSFTQPKTANAIQYHKDESFGMIRVEVLCNTCDAHLGHVFPDGPEPSGLRYCINSESMRLQTNKKGRNEVMKTNKLEVLTVGGGCFWCTEAIFQQVKGVEKVISGYSGGKAPGKPTYREVCSGLTGHAEVIQVSYDPSIISYEDLLVIFMTSHDPTSLNRQGADAGTEYRSVIFYHNDKQKEIAELVVREIATHYENAIVTDISPLINFYDAEKGHQNFYNQNRNQGYCNYVITPKLVKLRRLYADKLIA